MRDLALPQLNDPIGVGKMSTGKPEVNLNVRNKGPIPNSSGTMYYFVL